MGTQCLGVFHIFSQLEDLKIRTRSDSVTTLLEKNPDPMVSLAGEEHHYQLVIKFTKKIGEIDYYNQRIFKKEEILGFGEYRTPIELMIIDVTRSWINIRARQVGLMEEEDE